MTLRLNETRARAWSTPTKSSSVRKPRRR